MIGTLKKTYSRAFDPGEVKLLAEVFAKAWETVQKNGAYANGFSEDARTILAKQIMRQALAGERDRLVLLYGALKYMQRRARLRHSPSESFSYNDRVSPMPSPLLSFSRRAVNAYRPSGRLLPEHRPHFPSSRWPSGPR
jgi:hypothetical protein